MKNSFYPHTYYPGQLGVEPGISQGVVDELRGMGHDIVSVASAGMGATVNTRDPETGVLASSADPRAGRATRCRGSDYKPCHKRLSHRRGASLVDALIPSPSMGEG